MWFLVGLLVGVPMGFLRGIYPGLGDLLFIGSGLAAWVSTDLVVGLVIAERAVGGPLLVGALAHSRGWDPHMEVGVEANAERAAWLSRQAVGNYVVVKMVVLCGGTLAVLCGLPGVGLTQAGMGAISHGLAIVLVVLLVVTSPKRWATLVLLGGAALMALYLKGRYVESPTYVVAILLYGISTQVMGDGKGNRKGNRRVRPHQGELSDKPDHVWAGLSGVVSSVLVGIPGSVLLGFQERSPEVKYLEGSTAYGMADGVTLLMLAANGGLRGELSNVGESAATGQWGIWQAVALLGVTGILTMWAHSKSDLVGGLAAMGSGVPNEALRLVGCLGLLTYMVGWALVVPLLVVGLLTGRFLGRVGLPAGSTVGVTMVVTLVVMQL